VPEPSTWCAAALTAAVILWRLRHPLSGWSRPTSNSNPRL
jgi:hypothetical protein